MPTYTISAPDGNTYSIEGPDGASQQEVVAKVLEQYPESGNAPTKESGVLAGVKKGFEQLASQGKTVVGTVTGDANEAAKAALARNRAMDQKYADQVSLEKIKDVYNKEGLLSAAGETASQIPLAIAEQLPNFGASFAGAKAGAMAGSKAGSIFGARGKALGAIGGGLAGTFAPSYVQSFGGNIERQAQEQEQAKKPIEIDTAKAAATALPQAALDVASDRILLGGKMFGKMIGVPEKLLMQGGSEGLEKLAKERLLTTIAKGTATGIAGEIPTEVTQQALERYQAGLSLTDEDALKEYGETAYQVALLGPLGIAGRLSEKGAAQSDLQRQALEKQRADAAAAAEAAPKAPDITDPAYLQQIQTQYQELEQNKVDLKSQLRKIEDGSLTETADRLHNKDIEEQIKAMTPQLEQLASEYNKAIKVAPAFTPEPISTPEFVLPELTLPKLIQPTLTVGDALDNPLGRFTKEELSSRSPQVVDYIDEQRKILGKPVLNDYSIEDIRDAMPGELPKAEKADLNSLIAAKTGYTPEVTYKPQDIINVAKQKNIATDTDGFKFFLQRATGDNDLSKMEQPQLHSAFTALSALPEFDETQYLPEKTNAVHYSQQQYLKAVEGVNGLASEKDIPSAQALQVAKQATGLTRASDAQLLLQNAYTNGDLNLNSAGEFIKVTPAEQAEFKVEEGFAPAQPTGFNVMRGDQLLFSTQNPAEANAKVESLSKVADPAIKQIDKSITNERNAVAASQRSLSIMETAGLFRTPKYQQASAEHAALVEKANDTIQRLHEKKAYLQQPVTIQTTGKAANVKIYRAKEQGVSEKAFNTREEALKHILENLPAARLNELAGKTKSPGFAKRLQSEVERRKNPPKPFLATKPAPKQETKTEKPEATAEKEAVKSQLLPMLKKFGLGDIALQIEEGMKEEGSYAASVIKVALDANNPVRVLRHESMHGLKDLGFFAPGQWKVLENQADKVWIDKYLKQRNINGQPIKEGQQSRYDAYQNLYDGDMEAIREEAIADAFGDFDVNGAPKGLMSTLLKQMQQFFEALRNAFTGAGFQTSDDVFGQVERGELKATKKASAEEKASLRTSTDEVPLSTRRIMESNKTFAQNELGLSIVKKKGATGDNNVRDVANALNKQTLQQFGEIDRNDRSKAASDKLADAIADEVAYQLGTTSATGTGTGWYSSNYPKALKRLAARFPELENNQHARSAFSALVAITSNGERVDKNISNAIELYSKLRDGKPLVAMGVRRATALDNNLVNLQNLLQQYGTDFQKEMTKEITVRDLNAYLRSQGEEADNSYLAETKIPAAAIHFGPKLGAFFANLSGSEGYLTMDLWWTRSMNRMRGQLMPQATESSISKFREMMDKPDATRDEVVAATIPFRNKYEDYGYQTELEYLAKSKEPNTNAGKAEWFAKAKKAAGAAYPQLEYEHKMEKMANTIYKNEYDMLAEAPFGASDRQFMYDAARKAQNILANKGVNLTLADIQAALWYYEKRLYAKLTGREADDIGYEEAIIAQSKNGNGRTRPSVVFSGQPDSGNVTAREVAVPDQVGRRVNEEKLSLRSAPDTPEFKRWFKDSKVVDQNGKPLVVYHGTKNSFDEFSLKFRRDDQGNDQFGPGYYTSTSATGADAYANGEGANIMPLYVSLQNPIDLDTPAFGRSVVERLLRASPDFHEVIQNFGDVRYLGEAKVVRSAVDGFSGYENALQQLSVLQRDFWPGEPEAFLRSAKKITGRDGVVIDNGGAGNFYIAWTPEQIKSATGNIGTYDTTNPDIRYSLRTAPDTPEFKRWFGNSKIVDANGNPKVMYHGLAKDTTDFTRKTDRGVPIFLTDDPDFAGRFAKDSFDYVARDPSQYLTKEQLNNGIKRAIKAIKKDYGNSKDALDMLKSIASGDIKNATPDAKEYLRSEFKDMLPAGPHIMPVYVRAEKPFDYAKPADVRKVVTALKDNVGDYPVAIGDGKMVRAKDIGAVLGSGNWQSIESEDVQQAIKDAGFDSFYVREHGVKNLAVYQSNQLKSATGNIGTYDINNPDVRYSLREFHKDDLPQNKQTYTIPANTALFHGSHKTQAELIETAGKVLRSRPDVKASGGSTNEGGLIFFGEKKTAEDWAKNLGDPMSVKFDQDAGVVREGGKVFQTVTDRPYKLIKKRYELSAKEAAKVTEALGLPEYKSLSAGDTASLAADRGDSFNNSNAPRYEVTKSGRKQTMSAPWPIIFDALGVDGYFDDFGVAISAENGIRLEGKEGKMERYSLRTDVAEDINNLPNGAAINAAIDRVTTARQEVGFVDRLLEGLAPESWSYLRQKALDRYNRLNDFEKLIATQMGGVSRLADQNAHSAALQSDAAAGVAASALGVGDRIGGIPVYRNGYTTVSNENGTVKGAVEIFAPLAKHGNPRIYQAYQFWAGAKRGKRLLASGKEELYTPQDMALAKELEKQYPEFVDVQKDWIKYNDGLVKYAVDTGVISAKNAAEFTRYSDYVPFYRQIEGEHTIGPNIFQSISGVKAPKKLTGSEAPLADFLETITRNTQSIIQAGMKNVAAQKAVEGGMTLQMVRKMDHLSSGPNVVTVLQNGEKVSYECADKLWVDAVSSLNLPELPFLNFLAMPANFLRAAVTKDPGFMLANLLRDSVSAYVTSGAKLTPVASAVKEMGNVLMNNSPEYQKLLSAGVLGGYEFSRNVEASTEAFAKDLRKKTGTQTSFEKAKSPFTFFWDKLEKGTEASDAATRIAVYKATLAETGNEAEAIHRALEVMNFNRKGSSVVARIAAATIPFLNARVQGLDVFFRAGIRPFMDANATAQEKQVQRAMIIRGMTLMGLSVMYAAAVSGDPDYEKQEEETKDNNWIIPMGEGKTPLKIPIPFEVGTLFKTIPERIYRSFFMPDQENRDTTDDLHKSMMRAIKSTFAINPVPQIAAPLLEARDNFSVFTQRPIVGQNMQGIAPEYQVGPGTSKWAEILGKQAGMSPMMIDHVYKGYTGTMGIYAADLMDAAIESTYPSEVQKPAKRLEQMPVIKRFLADPEARGKITSYFDLKHSVDTTVRTINLLEKQGDPSLPDYVEKNAQLFAARDFMNNLNKQMDDLQKQANMIRAAPIPAEEKRDMLAEITKAQNLLVNDIRQIRNLIKP